MLPTTATASDAEVHAAYVKVGLTRDGNTFNHPGFLMAMDEEGVFVMEIDGREHEIAVSFVEVGERNFTIKIEYAVGGHTQWIERLEVEAGVDTELIKGKNTFTFNVDPQGSGDSSRDEGDKIDGPEDDPDDPLGGLELK